MSKIGTTEPVFIPRDPKEINPINPGEEYFWIKIANAQSAYNGSIWNKVKRLIITSKVALNDKRLNNKPIKAIQRYREVNKGTTVKLGLTPNLIKIVPATMTHISLSIDFLIDKKSNLTKLGSLINDDTFVSAISLAPGVASVAKTIGGVSEKLLQTFVDTEDQEPIMQFTGDFNISQGDLKDGYYAILGTQDTDNPLPLIHSTYGSSLTVKNDELFYNGRPIENLSYVLLKVRAVKARTREQNEGASWFNIIKEAEMLALSIKNNFLSTEEDKNEGWKKCISLLKNAQPLISNDPNYLFKEASDIIRQSYATCYEYIFGKESGMKEVSRSVDKASPEIDLDFLGVSDVNELMGSLNMYSLKTDMSKEALGEL